jgi:signal transduction histidine kinase/CheY-like chemotaxis protein
MFGYSRLDVVGKTTDELMAWVRESEECDYLTQLRENGYIHNYEAELRRKDGSIFKVLLSGKLLDIAGTTSILSTVMDVTEQKRLQEQLLQSQKMEVVGQLAGGIAHDFNNMLAGILGAAELIKQRMSVEDKNMKMVNLIVNAASRSADLTRDLLAFSRKGVKENSPVNINEIISSVISILERSIDKKVSVLTKSEAENPVVMGDASLLQNALLNLGVNARDAMPEGGSISYGTSIVVLNAADCQIHQNLLTPGPYLLITVSDTGVGIPKEIIGHIFEPFFTTKDQGKGTGLGLAAVYGTVRDHKGSIVVYSEPEHGTVFTIYLPVCGLRSRDSDQSKELVRGDCGILLVDDEYILRTTGCDLLEELGYTVYLAENGVQALELYTKHRDSISLVLLDIVMPKLNGKETFLQLKTIHPDVRVLFCSGFHQEGTASELRQLGAQGFIQKP